MSLDSFDGRFARLLASLIREAIINKTTNVAEGKAASFENYRERVGEINGLRSALELMKQAEDDLREG